MDIYIEQVKKSASPKVAVYEQHEQGNRKLLTYVYKDQRLESYRALKGMMYKYDGIVSKEHYEKTMADTRRRDNEGVPYVNT